MLPAERGADIAATSGEGAAKATHGAGPRRVRAEEALGVARFSPPRTDVPMHRGPPAPGAPMASIFGLFLLPRGCPRHFFPVAVDPEAAEEEEGSMALGKLSFLFGDEVVLGASGVWRRSRMHHLKREADVETSSSITGIETSAQCSCSEETCHHGGLTHQASLCRSPLHLASRGHVACSRPLHLHMVL
jgi:hypothetical protein